MLVLLHVLVHLPVLVAVLDRPVIRRQNGEDRHPQLLDAVCLPRLLRFVQGYVHVHANAAYRYRSLSLMPRKSAICWAYARGIRSSRLSTTARARAWGSPFSAGKTI